MPPVKAKSPALKIVLIVLGCLLALCCVGVGVGGFFVFRAAKDIGPAQDSAKSFVKDLESGDTGDAYSRLCASTKAAFPPAVFDSIVTAQPKIDDYKVVNTSVNNVNGRRTAQVVMDLTLASGRVERHTFLVSKENDKWLVCGTPY